MTNEELRSNLLGLGVYLRAQSNRLDKLGHDAEADASRRHAKYIVRLVNEWTPDAPAAPDALPKPGTKWQRRNPPPGDARAASPRTVTAYKVEVTDKLGGCSSWDAETFHDFFEPVPDEPELEEQTWYVTQRLGQGEVVLYRNRHSGDCANRWGGKQEARKFLLVEAGAVIESEVTRPGSRAVYVYGIEPAERVPA